ncbi:MAG: hypothetical protein R3C14_31435 [Caldilineaceae bacterium]
MPVSTCPERTSTAPNAQDAVWVANGPTNQLFYPYVSSCVAVTLVFANGLLGGHASQVTTNAQNPQLQPAQNLQAVINRMIPLAPAAATRGAFKKIYFIGTADDPGWQLAQATTQITTAFGAPTTAQPAKIDLTPVDIVFDTPSGTLYMVKRQGPSQGAAQTVIDAQAIDAELPY